MERILADNKHPTFRFARFIFVSVSVVCLIVIFLLGTAVVRDLNELRTARTDQVEWTLSQVEIEFLDFNLSLKAAQDEGEPALALLRKDFDVFYSRINIIASGSLFENARLQDAFSNAIDDVFVFLETTAVSIDSSNAMLLSMLPEIADRTDALRPTIRGLYNSGLSYFAAEADNLKAGLAKTLQQLSAATAFLLVLAGSLLIYTRFTNRTLVSHSQALGLANSRMETILATSLDAVIVADQDGHVIDFNPAAEKTFGYDLADVRGKTIGELIVPPSLQEAHEAGMKRMKETGKKKLVGHGHITIEACRSDGSIFPVELALESADSADGEIIIAFLRDISARVKNEQDLRTARDAALAGERAKAEFLNVMSHEIRTPLNGLLGNLMLMADTRLTAAQKQFHNNMQISGRQLMKHVNSVLDIARFESGKLPIKEHRFHVGDLVQDILDSQSAQSQGKGLSLNWANVGEKVDWIASDREHVERILLNLVSNAIKFTKQGGVTVEFERNGDILEFRVNDTGVGIAEHRLKKIFDDFESDGPSSGGTGLGLGIARRLVELLGGEIGVESTVGEGSVFWVHLPTRFIKRPNKRTRQKSQNKDMASLSILLVEDNEMNAFVAKHMLENQGHNVSLAVDGLKAYEALKKDTYDLVLMDINMPKLDGLSATKKIRSELPETALMPILAFSANVLPEDRDRFLKSGMDGFVGKPIQPDELSAALQAAVGGRLREPPTPHDSQRFGAEAKELLGDKYPDFLDRFITESDALIEWLQGGSDNMEETRQRCHKLIATAAMFGAEDYRDALRNAEIALKAGAPGKTLRSVIVSWQAARLGLLRSDLAS